MMSEQKHHVSISHIEQGEIKRASMKEAQKHKAVVRATLSNSNTRQDHHTTENEIHDGSLMKEELLRKLQLQRVKIQEEQERCDLAREAWVKHINEMKQKNSR